MGNAMSELAGRCKETAVRARSNTAAIEEAFYRALLRGKKAGELKGVRDPRAVARFLCSSLQGLILMAKATQDRKTLEDVVKVTLSVVN
jgi:TetR/AcrR family transcriptional repressor of nem operon